MNKNLTEEKTVIYLGPEGSYTEIAAENFIKRFGYTDCKFVTQSSILRVIQSIDNNNNCIGVVPIENSIEGIVRETIDNLVKTTSRVMITGEMVLPISHCLISKAAEIAQITKIMSISQALAQCQHFIAKNFSNEIELIPATSTSDAVRQLKDLPENYAAIGNYKASQIYGLNVIAEEINDEKDNLTRFVCLDSYITKPTGKDKTSIAFSTCNKTGALADILLAFKENGINLSYIESRPSKKIFGDYTFFIDFDGHIEDGNIQKTIGKIASLIRSYRFLGSYSKDQ